MACSFTISFNGTASALVASMRSKVLGGNGQFDGDDSSGKIAINAMGSTIEGRYGISGNEIAVTIDRKPFFVSCSMIESYMTSNLTG